ncbi:hypothetical protein Pelo_18995 [Pelomyxa schiedti]|nr:hypothetical protein Pelo_18995 [Pelomyxa schiedti]
MFSWFKSLMGPRVGPDEWFRAAFVGDTDALRRMLAGDPDLLNSVSDERQRVTALHAATWAGQPQFKGPYFEALTHKLVSLTSQTVCNTILIMLSLPFL